MLRNQRACIRSKDWRCHKSVSLQRDRPGGLTSPAFHACGSASPFRAYCCHRKNPSRITSPTRKYARIAHRAVHAYLSKRTCCTAVTSQAPFDQHTVCWRRACLQTYNHSHEHTHENKLLTRRGNTPNWQASTHVAYGHNHSKQARASCTRSHTNSRANKCTDNYHTRTSCVDA